MICNKCGNEVREGQGFCSICGNRVEAGFQQQNNINQQSFETNAQNNYANDQSANIEQGSNNNMNYEKMSFEQNNNVQSQFEQVNMNQDQNYNGQYQQNNNMNQNGFNNVNYNNPQNNNQSYQGFEVPKIDFKNISIKPLDIAFLAGAILAILSLFMTWVDVGIVTSNGFQQQGYLFIALFVYPIVQIIRKQEYNKIGAIAPLGLGLIFMIYFISTKNTTVYGIKVHCAKSGMYIMAIGILVSLVASIIGFILEYNSKPKNVGPNMMPNYNNVNQNNMYYNNVNPNNMNQGNANNNYNNNYNMNPNYNNMNQSYNNNNNVNNNQ